MSRYIPGVFFHQLKGSNGWSWYPSNSNLDVANIRMKFLRNKKD